MFEETERVVVLLDEFDEFVRERGSSAAEQFSRLLTTAMLPKLANIYKRARLVFIIATNNIAQFDPAIQRPGRFDHIVQVMPPTYDAKITKTNWGAESNVDLEGRFKSLGIKPDKKIKQQLNDLTYLECDAFATDLAKAGSAMEAKEGLDYHWKHCILQMANRDDKRTWAKRCKAEEHLSR